MNGPLSNHWHVIPAQSQGRHQRSRRMSASDPGARERFEWEARAIAALNHPHICTLYDVGNEEGRAFLVMEYLEGETLSGPMPIAEALRIATQIALWAESAHNWVTIGLVPRPLKLGTWSRLATFTTHSAEGVRQIMCRPPPSRSARQRSMMTRPRLGLRVGS